MKDLHYSVVIPVFNSESILPKTIERTVAFFEQQQLHYQIILINDGSSDQSWDVIKDACEKNNHLTGIDLLKNYGQHSAILCGFAHAKGDYIITMDDDLQNPPEEIAHLIKKASEGYDLVFGRFKEKKHSPIRRLGSKVIGYLNEKIFHKPREIVLTNFRIAHQEVINRALSYNTPYPYIPGLLLLHASKIANTWVEHNERETGKSNYTISRIMALVGRILFNYSSFPLKLMCGFGFAASLLSFLIGAGYLLNWLFRGVEVKGWTTLTVLMSFFFGLIVLILGVIGEYLIRLLNQQANTLCYIENTCINDETRM